MKCDQRGNIWVTAPGGVWVYAPDGDLLGKVRVPELVANLTWGGAGLPHAVHDRDALGLRGRDQGRAARRALHDAQSEAAEPAASSAAAPSIKADGLQLDPKRCALIIQDLQNDVIMEGGAFAASGAPAHARAQRVVENVAPARRGGARARRRR